MPIIEDDDTEEGEEKPRTVMITNGHEHLTSAFVPTEKLVGAQRRKSNVAHRINVEEKVKVIKVYKKIILNSYF